MENLQPANITLFLYLEVPLTETAEVLTLFCRDQDPLPVPEAQEFFLAPEGAESGRKGSFAQAGETGKFSKSKRVHWLYMH
jgi:hypothetical protein